MTFNEFSLSDSLTKAVEAMGFEHATPVQEKVIPSILENERDVVALAHTGTGKTAAFGLPLIERLRNTAQKTGALVLCPTRELAIQITSELRSYAAGLPHVKIDAVYGGTGYGEQFHLLKEGVHILVATPGRLLDLMYKGKTDFSNLEYLVLDEADIMLNMGFKEEIDAILNMLPSSRRSLLFSATMPDEVARIASSYMHEPITLTSGTKNAAAENIEHRYFHIHRKEKYGALKRLVDYHPEMYGIVFCRTKASTQDIADRLVAEGYNAEALHGDLSQTQRGHVMKNFRRGTIQLIVATDIAARGLDVEELTHVIHYDLPDEIDIYTHRSGRTGRAGKKGTSYALVTSSEKNRIRRIEKNIQRKIEKGSMPTREEVFNSRLLEFTDRLVSADTREEDLEPHFYSLRDKLGDMSRDELLQKLVSMQFKGMMDYYRNLPSLSTPEDLSSEKSKNKSKKERSKSHNKSRSAPSRSRRGRGEIEEGFESIQVNLGKRDSVAPPDLIGLVNQSSRNRGIEIGRINISPKWSVLQIEEEHARRVAEALDGFTYKGRKVRAQIKAS